MIRPCCTLAVLMLLLASFGDHNLRAGEDSLAWARENINAGKYNDAIELIKKQLPNGPADAGAQREAALLLLEPLRITGKLAEARQYCEALLKADDKDSSVTLIKAELDYEVGNYQEARAAYDKIIEADPKNHRAWALRSMVLRTLNDRAALKKTADHFFELYSANKEAYTAQDAAPDPYELAYIALGFQDDDPKSAFELGFMMAEHYAKKKGLKIPEILLWTARLAHEKYHFNFASKRYLQVLALRPKLPDALSGQAALSWMQSHNREATEKMLKDALEINPQHLDSLLLYAAVELDEDRHDEAKKHIDAALAINPNSIPGLAMLAFYYIDTQQPQKEAEVEKRVLAINPKCVEYYYSIGQLMESKRGFHAAPAYYEKALTIDPEDWRGYYGLGMNTSRQGAHGEQKGKELLLKAFAKNRFNVWASNMIKVLDKIIGDKEQEVPPTYIEFRTRHFIIKAHQKEVAILKPYLELWAEEAYEHQTKLFKFEPEGPLTIELCHNSGDQAARTVGMPIMGILGVCFGKLCTVVSPSDRAGTGGEPFNWKKVLEHEFAHVMVLQLSKFRVPRWYTEAFSTYVENDSRLNTDQKMKDYISRDKIKDLDKMNEYFGSDMIMAYVHGRYVIEYIDKTHGFDAHIKAIKLFAEGKKVHEALKEATGKELKELNEGQRQFVKKFFENIRLRPMYDPPTMVSLELAARQADASAQATADWAWAVYARQRKVKTAEQLAQKALEKDPNCVDAMNLLGALAYDNKDYEGAKQFFIASTKAAPDRSFEAWRRLGVIYKKEGRTTRAIEAFETARAKYPRYVGPENPHYELPELYMDLEPAQPDKALAVWRDATNANTNDVEATVKGLKFALEQKNYQAAADFAMTHIAIDPYNLEVHQLAAKAYDELKDWRCAAREYAVATALEEKDVGSWLGQARAFKALGDTGAAQRAIDAALEIDGTLEEAKKIKAELSLQRR